MACASVSLVVMVLMEKGTEVLSVSIELILSPGVGVLTLGSRTCVGRGVDTGELVPILGAMLTSLEGDGLGILGLLIGLMGRAGRSDQTQVLVNLLARA